MSRIGLYLIVAIVVSFYLFPFGLHMLPAGINTKNILAILGIPILGYRIIVNRKFHISKELLGAVFLALIFSLVCFVAVDINHTNDFSYASYIVSFSVWMLGAVTVDYCIRLVHGQASFKILVFYLAFVCAAQCVLALCIDRIPAFQMLVDSYVDQGQEFLQEVDRLYGIGASIDNAGIRFSVVLVLMAALLVKEDSVRNNRWIILTLLLAFYIIAVVGNMMSRTTIIGVGVAFFFLIQATGIFKMVLKREYLKFYIIFLLFLVFAIVVVTYFYNTDKNFYTQIRFAFEGFFNWMEEGEWRTDSTDKLNRTMWVWPAPDDIKTWIIGKGLFDNWVFGTDIGYCRFILYCGLVGLSVFALFFVYNAAVFAYANPMYRDLFFCLLCLTFIIWVKVSTDIFTFYALFYNLDYFYNRSKVPVETDRKYHSSIVSA